MRTKCHICDCLRELLEMARPLRLPATHEREQLNLVKLLYETRNKIPVSSTTPTTSAPIAKHLVLGRLLPNGDGF